jgi:hypothetical protein
MSTIKDIKWLAGRFLTEPDTAILELLSISVNSVNILIFKTLGGNFG